MDHNIPMYVFVGSAAMVTCPKDQQAQIISVFRVQPFTSFPWVVIISSCAILIQYNNS